MNPANDNPSEDTRENRSMGDFASLAELANASALREIDLDAINGEIAAGYIRCELHPNFNVRILNYTARTQYEWRWNQSTMQCRGLILDDQNKLIARPFAKFFSYDQLAGNVPAEPFDVFEKMDGSLGVLYQVDGNPFIATRGSFSGEQAVAANQIYQRKYRHISLDPNLTYLFEIIYPDNRIVVDYGDKEDLILLAVIDTATGAECALPDIGFPLVQKYDGVDDFQTLLQQPARNREGFVIRFRHGMRVKVKFQEYNRLHKLLTGVNAKHVWHCLSAGDELDALLERVPDEYYNWVRRIEKDLREQFDATEAALKKEFAQAPQFASRREAAEYFLKSESSAVMFAMLDDKEYAPLIWNQLRPTTTRSFKCDDNR